MKQIGEASARAARQRKFHWCRRLNGFSDMPLWRVVAARLDLPLFQVLAFVNRLEELANGAEQRGHVGDFSAAEFGAALGMSGEDAGRIFAELERPEVGWVAYDHIANFYDRNPDRDDDRENAAERKRRERTRKKITEALGRLAAQGKIKEIDRLATEVSLKDLTDTALWELRAKLERAELSTVAPELSTVTPVTCDTRDAVDNFSESSDSNALAMSRLSHVTSRDIVTVTPEKRRDLRQPGTFGALARGDSAGPAMGSPGGSAADLEVATAFLDGEGKQAIVERMNITPLQAETLLGRWRRDLRDDIALANIVKGVTLLDCRGHRFQIFISDQVQRTVQRGGQQQLPLPPTPLSSKRGLA